MGYYSRNKLVTGEPSGVGFYEEYPDQANAWTYHHYDIDETFDANVDEFEASRSADKSEVRKHLDELHK